MKISAIAFFVLIGFIIYGCTGTENAIEPSAVAEQAEGATEQSAEPAAAQPTAGPTATVWPPIFDPTSLGDIREQDSFVVTVNDQNVYGGQLTERTLTMGYIKEPYAAYFINEFSSGVEKTYVIDGLTYARTGTGDWYIDTRKIDVLSEADLPAANTSLLADAMFVGEEEYEGVAAYHFVLDQTPLPDSNYWKEGEFYLAKDGNYVLFSRWRSGTSDADYSLVTETFSSINQLREIALPVEMQGMPSVAEVPNELGLPLPPKSAFQSMISYRSTGVLSGIDNYYFTTPRMDEAEFLDFYRNLPATDGWTVSHIGFVTRHGTDCQELHECVIINKGGTQVVLSYDESTIRAEFDWNQIFAPMQ